MSDHPSVGSRYPEQNMDPVHREKCIREFQEWQRKRSREIRARLKAMRDAEKAGTYDPRNFPPLYE
jgi:hypothetical protein